MKRKLSLNGLQLKQIGWVLTLCSLAAVLLFPAKSGDFGAFLLSLMGYAALPIFAFLLVEGFAYTQNVKRYGLTILLAAVLAEPFYDFACYGVWFTLGGDNGQNTLFAMALAVVQLYFLRYMGTGDLGKSISSVMLVIASAFWCFFLNISGGIYFQIIVGLFYLLREHPKARSWTVGAVSLVMTGAGILAIPLIHAYNQERGKYNKYLFYIAWPLCWAACAMIRLFSA